jgi:hypothetical protein
MKPVTEKECLASIERIEARIKALEGNIVSSQRKYLESLIRDKAWWIDQLNQIRKAS